MSREHQELVEQLLIGLSDLEVRELCLEALRQFREGCPNQDTFRLNDHLGRNLLPLLGSRKDKPVVHWAKEVFINCLDKPWMAGVVEFIVWFTRAGLGVGLVASKEPYPNAIRLTTAGKRLLDHQGDHPLLPSSIERCCARCPGLPDGVASLLADAHACIDHGFLRPAVTVLGVAYESAIDDIVVELVSRNILDKRVLDQKAARRIEAVKDKIDKVMCGKKAQDKDDRFATHEAYDFANALRRRRNDASHTKPTYGFEDREEIEELFVSALRHLPNLWRMHDAP